MIDTYFDRADAAAGITPTYRPAALDDPRIYAGQLYASVLDRMVAEAKAKVLYAVAWVVWEHKTEMHCGIPVGSKHSLFTSRGLRK
jgi:hypothetical protein